MIDRIVHHAEIITIDGDSYRRREAEAAKKTRHAKRQSPRKPGGPKNRGSLFFFEGHMQDEKPDEGGFLGECWRSLGPAGRHTLLLLTKLPQH